jgi:SAM-dependent methyltransferase
LFLRETGADASTRIVDIGCGIGGLAVLAPSLNITGVDMHPLGEYPKPFVQADATVELPFADGEFDLAYCSSVIEHVPVDRRSRFASELRRVSRGWFVQTPAFGFPIEPHALLVGAYWLPSGLRERYWRWGVSGDDPAEITLLRRREFEALFGPARAERFGPLTKSWIALKRP